MALKKKASDKRSPAWTPVAEALLTPEAPATEATSLHRELALASKRHGELSKALRELKRDWAAKNIKSQECHQPIAPSEIAFVENRRRELHLELERTQAIIGQLGKTIRARKAERQVSRARGNGAKQSAGPAHDDDDRDRHPHADSEADTFLSCFFQIAKDSLDPRQFKALEDGARALVKDYQRMHQEDGLA